MDSNKLIDVYPNLVLEFLTNKNEGIRVDELTIGSGRKVWWKCKRNHEWQATVSNRVQGRGCPYCAGRKILSGVNDMETLHPELAAEWDAEKNGIEPNVVAPNSNVKYWWKCNKGHRWEASPNNRTYGKGCPFCAGRYVITGENDLLTLNPEVAAEWDYVKNAPKRPENVMPWSNKKMWWHLVLCQDLVQIKMRGSAS